MSRRRTLLVIAVAAVLVAIAAWPRQPRRARPVAVTPVVVAAAPRIGPRPAPPPEVSAATDLLHPVAAGLAVDTKARYLAGAVYPPWSQPATPAWKPFIDWNAPREHADDEFALDPAGQAVRAAVVLDKLYARPDETITATVVVWRGDRMARQKPIDFTADARIQLWDQDAFDEQKWDSRNLTAGYTSVSEVELRPVSGRPNELRGRFVPSQIAALAGGADSVRFIATLRVKGKHGATIKPLELEFQYSPEEPLVIIDRVGDRVDDTGSLEVEFEADVRVATAIKIEATLFDAGGELPVAVYQEFFRPTATGRQRLTVRFFGKAIRDQGIAGPYTLTVHGFSSDLSRTPSEQPWRDDRVFTTAAYRLDEFSDGEWEDPAKDDMIATYDRIIAGFGGAP